MATPYEPRNFPKAEQVTGRLEVRRIPDLNPGNKDAQETLFDTWRS